MRTIIKTKNKEFYNAFNSLLFNSEVKVARSRGITRILNNINKKYPIITSHNEKDRVVLKKINNFKCNIYYTGDYANE